MVSRLDDAREQEHGVEHGDFSAFEASMPAGLPEAACGLP